MKKKVAKELALITAIITRNELLKGSVFSTFDQAYKIAREFIKRYPVGFEWQGNDYEGTIERFVELYFDKNSYVGISDKIPAEVAEIVMSWTDNNNSHSECVRIKAALEKIGWTCDYGKGYEVSNVRLKYNEDEPELMEEYDSLPQHIKDIVDSWDDNKDLYAECARIKAELEKLGWSCEYGLSGEIYDVRQKAENEL